MDLFHDAVNQNDEDAVEAANGAEAEMNDGQRNMQKKKQQVDEKYETLFFSSPLAFLDLHSRTSNS